MALRVRRSGGEVPPDGGSSSAEPPFDPSVLGEVSGMVSVASRNATPDLAPAQDSSPFDLASSSPIPSEDLSERLAEMQLSLATLEQEILTAKQMHASDLNLIDAAKLDATKAREELESQKAINEGISRLHDEAEAKLVLAAEEIAKTQADLQRVTEESVVADVRAKRYRNERNDERERVRTERDRADALERDLEVLRGEKDILVRNYDALLLDRKRLTQKIFVLESRAPFAAPSQPIVAAEPGTAPSRTPLERFLSFIERARRVSATTHDVARIVERHWSPPSAPPAPRTAAVVRSTSRARNAAIAVVCVLVLALCVVLVLWGNQALRPAAAPRATTPSVRVLTASPAQPDMFLLQEGGSIRGCIILTGETASIHAWENGSFTPRGTRAVPGGGAAVSSHADEAWAILDATR